MSSKLIAVSVDENNQICDHAGRAKSWDVYYLDSAEKTPVCLWSIALSDSGILHEWHAYEQNNTHPLHLADVAISGSAGSGVRRKFAEKNTEFLATVEKDPLLAVKKYMAGNLDIAPEDSNCTCNCSH